MTRWRIGGTAGTAEAASGGPYGFSWTVNVSRRARRLLVSPTGTTTYDVQGVDGAGCVTQPGSVTVGIYDGFTVDITDNLICLGDEVLLSAIDDGRRGQRIQLRYL